MPAYKILHITPHLGGGVGSVLMAYFAHAAGYDKHTHTVACLDTVNAVTLEKSNVCGVDVFQQVHKSQSIFALIAKADVVLVHWWNHPLLYDFLMRNPLPPARVIFWSHISGFDAPYVFIPELFVYADKFIFTTPISYDVGIIKQLPENLKEKLDCVWATTGIEHLIRLKKNPHTGVNIGYVGTVDFAKLHPDFLDICAKVNTPDVHFYFCGGNQHEQMRRAAAKRGLSDKVTFTGPVDRVEEWLSMLDVFCYPLASHHFGTCDQVLAEAMAAGIPPVVFGNKMESSMVQNAVTGLVADDIPGFISLLTSLTTNEQLRKTIAENARNYATKKFVVADMAAKWDYLFHEMMSHAKKSRTWPLPHDKAVDLTAADIFVASLGDPSLPFAAYQKAASQAERDKHLYRIKTLGASPRWQSQTKGTVYQYNRFFPEDTTLKNWVNAMDDRHNKSFAELDQFNLESQERVKSYKNNHNLQHASKALFEELGYAKYPYNFYWCGVPIIQLPADLQAFQEIIWEVKPDCIIETGIAWGGSLMFSASMMCILEACGSIKDGTVIGIDIDIRAHNKKNILGHPLAHKITLVEGSSIADETLQQVKKLITDKTRILVFLDSNHTHEHVIEELRLYTPFVSVGSYCIVEDTTIEFASRQAVDRPWGQGNSPKTAIDQFLQECDSFRSCPIDDKLLITGCVNGYLKRLK